MAIVINPLLGEITGKFGDASFRYRKGKIILQSRPGRGNMKKSPITMEQNERFRLACIEAKMKLRDPVVRAEYRARKVEGVTVFRMVLTEILSPPPGLPQMGEE